MSKEKGRGGVPLRPGSTPRPTRGTLLCCVRGTRPSEWRWEPDFRARQCPTGLGTCKGPPGPGHGLVIEQAVDFEAHVGRAMLVYPGAGRPAVVLPSQGRARVVRAALAVLDKYPPPLCHLPPRATSPGGGEPGT